MEEQPQIRVNQFLYKFHCLKEVLPRSVNYDNKTVLTASLFQGKNMIGILFSANWSASSCEFQHSLQKCYDNLNNNQSAKFHIIFVSSDNSKEEFDLHLGNMPWYAVPFDDPYKVSHFPEHI